MKILRSGASVASAIMPLAKTVGGLVTMLNTERKFFDYSNLNQPLSGLTPFINNLIATNQGTDYTERIGRSIRMLDITIRWNYVIDPQVPTERVRLTLVCDKFIDAAEAESANQIVAKLYQDSTNPTYSPINRDYSDRFVIMKDWLFAGSVAARPNIAKKYFQKLGFHQKYTGTLDTNYAEGTIYIVCTSDNLSSTDFSSFSLESRVNFTDT